MFSERVLNHLTKKSNQSFKIALVAPPWWLIPSGNIVTATEHIVEDYAFNLRKHGYRSVIFSRERDSTDSNDITDVNHYKNQYRYTKVSYVDRRFFKETHSLLFYLLYILKVSLRIRKLGIRRVIVFQTLPFCFWIKLINPGIKVLYYTVNHELSRNDNYYRYGTITDDLAYKVLPKVDHIITMSNYIRDGIVSRFPYMKMKCKTVYIGIDTDIFKEKKKDIKEEIIIYSGRIVPEKGIHLLVNAFKNLSKDFPNAQLYLLGSAIGPNIPSDYSDIFNYEGIKTFGLLPRIKVAEILRKATIFVYPVIWEEPFGLAPVEAMVVGIPTVVSRTKSGYSEIINDENGYYFNNNDEKDLERVLRSLLLSKGEQKRVCRNAIDIVKRRLSWKKCIQDTISCFEEE